MAIKNSLATSEAVIPIEEKFLRFSANDKHGSIMIPLKNIVSIGNKGDKTAFEYFLVKSDIPLGPATGPASVQGNVAAWRITSSAANSKTKVEENAAHFVDHWENALAANRRHYHVDGADFPFPLDGIQVELVMATWIMEA